MIALVLVSTATARADEPEQPPAGAKPFLTGVEENVHTVTGAFGPAKDTMMVFTFNGQGEGSFSGFALVPDDKAKHGQRKLALPRLPIGSIEGGIRTALVANLDKDADDELAIAFHVFRTVSDGKGDGFSYGTTEYVVLDWNGKKFVRLPALEKKLVAKMESRESFQSSPLSDEDLRAALGVTQKP